MRFATARKMVGELLRAKEMVDAPRSGFTFRVMMMMMVVMVMMTLENKRDHLWPW